MEEDRCVLVYKNKTGDVVSAELMIDRLLLEVRNLTKENSRTVFTFEEDTEFYAGYLELGDDPEQLSFVLVEPIVTDQNFKSAGEFFEADWTKNLIEIEEFYNETRDYVLEVLQRQKVLKYKKEEPQ